MANRKRNISFARPEEPDFIKKLKERAGLTRGPDIDTKNEELEKADKSDFEDKDEEQPVVVVLKKGDLSEDEVKKISEELQKKQEEEDINDGKITFKKPDKSQTSDKKNDTIQSSVNKTKNEIIRQKIEENNMKSVRNSSLLSFNDEEDEEYSD